jgi:ketol-acid reductoisomerase
VSPPPKIVIANNKDSYSSKAEEDGFGFTSDWASAAAEADVLFLLVPDQVGLDNTMQLAAIDPVYSRFNLNCSISVLPRR